MKSLVLDAEALSSLAHHVDATVVATCATAGGGVILTTDMSDLAALAPAGSDIVVRGLARR